jgi:hypothetical protein
VVQEAPKQHVAIPMLEDVYTTVDARTLRRPTMTADAAQLHPPHIVQSDGKAEKAG